MTEILQRKFAFLAVAAFGAALPVLAAGQYYLSSSASNVDGPFTDATKWVDGEGQSAETFDPDADYVVKNGLILRSFNSTWDHRTFGGKSLSIGDGVSEGTMYHYAAAKKTENYTDIAGIYFNQLVLSKATTSTVPAL